MQLKAVRLIREADVIVYDDLGTGEAMELASDACEKIYVGKRGGRCDGQGMKSHHVIFSLCKAGYLIASSQGLGETRRNRQDSFGCLYESECCN